MLYLKYVNSYIIFQIFEQNPHDITPVFMLAYKPQLWDCTVTECHRYSTYLDRGHLYYNHWPSSECCFCASFFTGVNHHYVTILH